MATPGPNDLTPEQIERIIRERMRQIANKEVSRVWLFGNSLSGQTTHTKQRLDDAIIKLQDHQLGLPKGSAGEAGSWDMLKELLGERIVKNWRQ